MEELFTSSSTWSTSQYDDPIVGDLVEYVHKAKSEEDAVHNIKQILKSHKRRCEYQLSVWDLIKLLFNK